MGDAEGGRRRVPAVLRSRRLLTVAATVLAALLWWPVGFWGLDAWPGAPLRALEGDVVALSATASAAVVAALVRDPWPRIAVVAGCSALAWWTTAPAVDTVPDEREVLVLLLLAAGVTGVLLGRAGRRGVVSLATVLAAVAALTQATWPTGVLLAVALALPFTVAVWDRVAPTLWSVMGVLLAWLVLALGALALRQGWDVLHPQMNAGSKRAELRLVLEASWDFLLTQWRPAATGLLEAQALWIWVAAVLALLVAATRLVTPLLLGRVAPASRAARLAGRVTSGAPRR